MHPDQNHLTNEIVALVGSPNSGKTTLYNWMTNSKFKTVNYPGATVEYAIGSTAPRLGPIFLAMDTPGTYSLFPKSLDEEVTLKALFDPVPQGQVKQVILVVDGTQLERHLFLAEQLKEAGFSFVIVITMSDLLRKNKILFKKEVLENHFQVPVVLFDGVLGAGLEDVARSLKLIDLKSPRKLSPWSEEKTHQVKEKLRTLSQEVYGENTKVNAIYDQTAKIDRLLLHPFFGLLIFFLVMSTIFSSIFWLATPLMDAVDGAFSWLGDFILSQSVSGNLAADFLANGIIASFASVFVFVPQIFILFLSIGLLEGSGYLARAATLIDRPFAKLGLSGRSFVPLLSGFACAVPAMMATRNMTSQRDRTITNFIIPLMTCSARLPVYALLLSFLFKGQPAWKAGVVLAGLYLCSLAIGALAAAVLNRIIEKSGKSFFMMELPLYRLPKFLVLITQALQRTKAYVYRAGPVIFLFAVLIWVGTTFPAYQATSKTEKLQSSYLAQVGQKTEPLFAPMGVDWRVGVGLISAFAAREVFVSTMAIVFNITEENEESQQETLLSAMHEAKNSKGETIFTFSSVIGLILFFMIALQCMSTVAVSIRESGSYRFALVQLVLLNVFAYVISVGVVQGLRALGVA
jgi:ferrous iron transport protein B